MLILRVFSTFKNLKILENCNDIPDFKFQVQRNTRIGKTEDDFWMKIDTKMKTYQ